MSAIFGGGGSAAADARKARELQQIANDRQLAQANADSRRSSLSRARPRGRRLFADDADAKTNLS